MDGDETASVTDPAVAATGVLSMDVRFRVLARKYRPASFEALIGQEALVRTLGNAFRAGRIAHAWMLAGVRGVGKTTTARIIARALNCVGADGKGGVTMQPCGLCEHCVAIAEDRHLDVIEMDAASHTGVDNIRELLDGVPYRPALARYKVYIIDEVHMLSEKAFNALLKTLEEPPEHVKFVFATTELRKVPVTVLSRCQRFDLRRVEAGRLARHLAQVAASEGVAVAPEALRLLAQAAEGSVRDALSLLDQAIAYGAGAVDEDSVRDMLGLVDRVAALDILEQALSGDAPAALARFGQLYEAGGDPALIFDDLLRLTHWCTRLKLVPEVAEQADAPEAERQRGLAMAQRLGMGELTRAWQILLKGLGEVRSAPLPLHAAEMVLIRLAYAAQLPTPAEALAALRGMGDGGGSGGGGGEGGGGSAGRRNATAAATGTAAPAPVRVDQRPTTPSAERGASRGGSVQPATVRAEPVSHPDGATAAPAAGIASFSDVVALAHERREGMLHGQLLADVHLVRFEPRSIEMRLGPHASADLPQRLSRFLAEATGERWLVSISHAPGEASLHEQRLAVRAAERADALAHPLVRAILDAFPGASAGPVRQLPAQAAAESDDTEGSNTAE